MEPDEEHYFRLKNITSDRAKQQHDCIFRELFAFFLQFL